MVVPLLVSVETGLQRFQEAIHTNFKFFFQHPLAIFPDGTVLSTIYIEMAHWSVVMPKVTKNLPEDFLIISDNLLYGTVLNTLRLLLKGVGRY
jgi:hypothetical protein